MESRGVSVPGPSPMHRADSGGQEGGKGGQGGQGFLLPLPSPQARLWQALGDKRGGMKGKSVSFPDPSPWAGSDGQEGRKEEQGCLLPYPLPKGRH